MDLLDLHPPDDYTHRFFIWHEWIQANGPLTTQNVFDYFATSMFYDKQSNNQVLRMQTMHTAMAIANEAEELRRFTGIEFSLVHSQPPSFFIIQKRERLSPDDVIPLASYFIMNNRIYQAPDLYTVLSNRLLTSLCSLQASLDTLRKFRPEYTPRTGFAWPIIDPSITEDPNKKQDEEGQSTDAESVSTVSNSARKEESTKRQQNNLLLLNAMRTTAAHMRNQSPPGTVQPSENPPSATPSTQPLPPSTPAPTSSRGTTPRPSAGLQNIAESSKVQGPLKKKKKRMTTLPSDES
ncbi:hypothetical protein AMATHDRAFT_76297 [Amanita thiersii Skay4041]|uniref:Mediator of RNA polymerase II transcription subunit 6 n=1 Tax=Amanita thiersii Skay4041 TaxID=703135 RepID=A0A2A9NLJ4_9AGAR|nr:hypothetical protein AMATHDRAFT_76297 [Amanita thiersii Skay4041]